MAFAITRIVILIQLIVFVYAVLTVVMSPYHPVREALARFIEPLLQPLRRVVPPVGGLDLSPLVLIILVQLFGMILNAMITNFFG